MQLNFRGKNGLLIHQAIHNYRFSLVGKDIHEFLQ
jgi:hypothetical protein